MVKIEITILKYLVEHNSSKFSISQISNTLCLDYKNTHQAIQKLHEEDLITLEKIGNTNQIQYNLSFNHEILKVEQLRREELFKNKNFKLIHNKIKKLNNPFLIVLVFGSYAKKTQSKQSDIDLCVICNEEKTIKQLNEVLTLLPIEIDINVFSTDEFIRMIKTTQFSVGHEIMKNNIIIFGIENYYNLIQQE